MKNKHIGSSFEEFLKEEGIYEETHGAAVKRVLAWQIQRAMKDQKISKNKMAKCMKTSRTQIERLLDPENDSVQLSTIQRAATIIGCRLVIGLEPVGT
jgi:antitoxin HicB